MAALTDRQAARARLQKVMEGLLDRFIPADERQPMKGQTFREFEDQADEFDRQITGAFLEELASLSPAAEVEQAGLCPHCGSQRVYLVKNGGRKTELQSKHGIVVIPPQQCRCRSCDRTFSPSGPRVGSAAAGPHPHAQGGRAGDDRVGDGVV